MLLSRKGIIARGIPKIHSYQTFLSISKDVGWEVYEDSPSYALQYPPRKEYQWKDPTVTIYLTVSSYR